MNDFIAFFNWLGRNKQRRFYTQFLLLQFIEQIQQFSDPADCGCTDFTDSYLIRHGRENDTKYKYDSKRENVISTYRLSITLDSVIRNCPSPELQYEYFNWNQNLKHTPRPTSPAEATEFDHLQNELNNHKDLNENYGMDLDENYVMDGIETAASMVLDSSDNEYDSMKNFSNGACTDNVLEDPDVRKWMDE